MGLAHSPRIVTDGLVLALDAANVKSYVGSGSTWYDLSSSGNNGTPANFLHVSGSSGYFDFNGSSTTIRMSADMFDPNTDFTFSSWVNSDVTPNERATIISDASASGALQIGFTSTSYVDVSDSNVTGVGTFTNFTYSAGTWYNVVVTRSSDTYSLYVNGSYKSNFTSTNSYTNGPQSIGSNYVSSDGGLSGGGGGGGGPGGGGGGSPPPPPSPPPPSGGGGGQLWDGKISQITCYNRALTASEVKQNFNAHRGRYGI